MANIRVKQRLDSIASDLRIVKSYVSQYGGISAKDASDIRLSLESIIEDSYEIGERLPPTSRVRDVGSIRRIRRYE